jgi:BlaI family transcriptional regulator, penicillinase repressor
VQAYGLTRYELELMDVLWKKETATVQEVCEALNRPLAYTTVMTTLSLLESKKGVLAREKRGRAFIYRPLVSRDDVTRTLLDDLRGVLFEDSLPSLVLNMLSTADLSGADVQAIKLAIEKLEAKS